MKNLTTIKEKIHTVNLKISDELLDLLYEYFFTRYTESFKLTNNMSDLIEGICNPLKSTKEVS